MKKINLDIMIQEIAVMEANKIISKEEDKKQKISLLQKTINQ